MAGDRADGKARQVAIGNTDGAVQLTDEGAETGAEHDAVARLDAAEQCGEQADRRLHPSSVSKLKGRSSSIVMVFFTPVSSQR